jgi:hypothetical protein
MQKRRYEILLPLKHNDGREVNPELFQQTREELIGQFGAVTVMPHAVLGYWVSQETRFEGELLRMVVDVDDTQENGHFFADFKVVLLRRFEQLEIYIASYPLDIL